jgi:hypothetical protein
MDYNYIQSLLVIKNLSKLKTRIIQQNVPQEIERLQCIFIESFPITILSIYEISKLPDANIPGIDGVFFKTINDKKYEFRQKMLKGTRYSKSNKIYKTRTKLPTKSIITDSILKRLISELEEETLLFRFNLLKKCNLKTVRKNYKGRNFHNLWVSKNLSNKSSLSSIPTIRDRVLQQIVVWGIQPICESQGDSLSFNFREQKFAIHAVAYIYRKLSKIKVLLRKKESKFISM